MADENQNIQSSRERIARMRRAMEIQDIQSFFVRDTSNITWLTAFDNVFDEEQAHAAFVDGQKAVLHTDSRYAHACEIAAEGGPFSIESQRESHQMWLTHQIGQAWSLGIEDTMALKDYRALEEALEETSLHPRIVETSDLIVGLRAVKDQMEIDRMKHAQSITDAALQHMLSFMTEGMTERQVQLELDDFMRRHGAEGLAFPSIVASGAHAASPHAQPGEKRLEKGECVVMDFGARANGYDSDMTRTIFVGQPSEKLANAFGVIRKANETVEAMLKPGVTGAEAHQKAEDILAEGGYAGKMGHGLGHGVGIDIHESPVLAPRNKKSLVQGNVVTVEPGIYIDNDFGMRLEDFGVITDDGYEVFTKSPHDLLII